MQNSSTLPTTHTTSDNASASVAAKVSPAAKPYSADGDKTTGLDDRYVPTPAELARVFPRVGERRWSQRVPALYPIAVRYHRARRRIEWMRSGTAFARTKQNEDLPIRVKRHKSLLLRQLGETEMWLQHTKVTNLKLACERCASPGQEHPPPQRKGHRLDELREHSEGRGAWLHHHSGRQRS